MLIAFLALAAAAQVPDVRTLLPKGENAPGCALDVRRNGAPVDSVATGLANLEDGARIDQNTVFEVGSVSKQFIGAGIAILAERGRLSLADPITKWLPELPPLYHGITIAMLVHHTSGIRSWNNLAELTGRGEDSTGYGNAWVLAAVARQRRLNHPPGAEYLYSNSNFVLAAIIIERASAKPLNDFYREALFVRLGMAHTSWRTDFRDIVPGRAQAYLPNEKGGWQLDMPLNGVAGAGGLLSTVGDLQLWNTALQNPAPEDRGWVKALLQPGALADGTPLRYGMGIELSPVAGRPAFSHAGSTASYRAWLGFFPEFRLSVALLCNSGAVNTEDLGEEVAARYLPQGSAATAVAAVKITVPADLAGLYRNMANDSVVEAKADARGLHFNGGAGFGMIAPGRLSTADGRRTATLTRSQDGRPTLAITRIGNAPTLLERVAVWRPGADELRLVIGAYASAEIDGVQRIKLRGAELTWRDPAGAVHPLTPIYDQAFDAPGTSWTLRFRKERGQIMLDMSITRARRIEFHRIP
ncbi:MAG TPA: serine hydrolase domain-containing protein [Sphingomonas sp.]|jgi:CubicO group peptidase (beta-lactamase class C family)|nr:serine hydrolase domain-containing protein [Sphingomonas sp.]